MDADLVRRPRFEPLPPCVTGERSTTECEYKAVCVLWEGCASDSRQLKTVIALYNYYFVVRPIRL